MAPHDDHHQRHQRGHAQRKQVTGQVGRARRASHHDGDAGEAEPGRSQGGETWGFAHPRPRDGGGGEGRGGVDDGYVGDSGVLERGDEADGRRTADGRGRPSRPTQMFPVREPRLTSTPHQPGRHHSSGQEPSPEQHGPYIRLDTLGEDPRRAPRDRRQRNEGRDRVRPAVRYRGPRRSPRPVSRTGVSRRAPDSVVSAVMEAGRRSVSRRDAFMLRRAFPPSPKSSVESL